LLVELSRLGYLSACSIPWKDTVRRYSAP